MQITFDSNISVTRQVAQVQSINSIIVERYVDVPSLSSVYAFVEGFGRIRLDALSNVNPGDNNYDNPEWSNASATLALSAAFVNSAINNTPLPTS